MKLMFASDLHGSAYYAQLLRNTYITEKAEKLIFLGDLLYHGPRNDLPRDYDTKAVTKILNDMKEELLCVRGNCDSEVDQMVLDFPIMADYTVMFEQGKTFFITHGHLFNTDNPPKLKSGDILIHGHTHVLTVTPFGKNIYINPGSVSLPKEGNPPSYMIFEDGVFSIKDFDGNTLLTHHA